MFAASLHKLGKYLVVLIFALHDLPLITTKFRRCENVPFYGFSKDR